MRKLWLLVALCSPLVQAESVSVEANTLLRLPANTSVLQLDRLDVADYATLLIPASVTQINVEQLRMGREARIAIVPAEREIALRATHAELGEGSQISARGAAGTYEKAARPARDLNVRFGSLQAHALAIDARGGTGAPGYTGLDGGNGQAPGCTWGAAGSGADGDHGGNGHQGAAGAHVRVELPRDFPSELIKVQVDGGVGGKAGEGGQAGAGGKSKGCIVYRADGAKAGRPGLSGQPGEAGAAGAVTIQRL
ncbi:collagen-like protein [Pseudomonas sp.]|uniref:collagen-like protein n=1 Tax=Pseudomonas sp. TaxID=306 RepID=UPI002606B3ED|nr:collagen-like protein [Pseudomonas sp.]